MTTLKQKKKAEKGKDKEDLVQVVKCNSCRTLLAITEYGFRKDGTTRYKTCMRCREETQEEKEKDKKKKERVTQVNKEMEVGIKYCKKCKDTLPISDFDTKSSGIPYVDCKKCRILKPKG
tara:strand:+ start:189 stop:548 length:360 start_codon:yes stop_codon:yes gene_type:complete